MRVVSRKNGWRKILYTKPDKKETVQAIVKDSTIQY